MANSVKKKKMNSKGFTLVEILATILIVSLIFGVGFYFVTNTINESKEKSRLISLSNVKSAAQLYVKEYTDGVPWREEKDQTGNFTGNYTACILVSDLIDAGFLEEDKIQGIVKEKNIILKKNSNGTIIEEKLDDSNVCLNNGIKIPTSKDYCNKVTYTGNPIELLNVGNSSNSLLNLKQLPNGFSFTINKEIKDAGQYEIIARLDSNQEWKDGKTEDKKIICTVDKTTPNFTMNPTGTPSSGVKTGSTTRAKLSTDVGGTLSISNSNGDYVSARLEGESNHIDVGSSVNLQIGFLATRRTTSYIRVTLTPDDIQNYKEVTLTYTVGDVERKKVAKPDSSICINPGYNGNSQRLINIGDNINGYAFFDIYGKEPGDYIVTAKLNYGYVWNDGKIEDVKIKCIIKESYTITFKGNGNDYGVMSTQTCKYNQDCILSANVFRKFGHDFVGWATSPTGSKVYDDSQKVRDIGDTTLYALWSPATYQVELNNQGASDSGTQNVWYRYKTTKNISGNTCYYFTNNALNSCLNNSKIEMPTKTGYIFGGYYTNANGNGTQYVDASGKFVNDIYKKYPAQINSSYTTKITLYAKWTPITYIIRFRENGGTGTMSDMDMTYDVAKKLFKNEFKKTGYIFKGWAKSSNGAVSFSDEESVNNLTAVNGAVVELFASWKPKTITITFNCTDGKKGNVGVNPQKFTYGIDNQKFNSNCIRTGYTGNKWYLDDKFTKGGYNWNSDVKGEWINDFVGDAGEVSITLYATWTANTYAINFSKNHSQASGSMSIQQMTYDETAKLSKNDFSRTGYTFDGWNTKADGSGINYSNEQSVKNLATSGIVTLFAKWKANVCTINFSPNGGRFNKNSGVLTQKINYGASSGNMRNASGTNGYYNATRSGYRVTGTIAWISSVGKRKYDQNKSYTATDICPSLANGNQSVTLSVNWWRYLYKTCSVGNRCANAGCASYNQSCTTHYVYTCPNPGLDTGTEAIDYNPCPKYNGGNYSRSYSSCTNSSCSSYNSSASKCGCQTWNSSWTTTACTVNANTCKRKRDYVIAQ